MLSPYRGILALPGARAFTLWGLVARLQMGLTGLSTFLLVQIEYGRYEYGGMILAAIAVSYAVVSPQVGRLVDAYGQSRVLRWGYAIAIVGRIAMIGAALTHQPIWVLVALAPLFTAGGTQSTHTRARWTHIVPDKHALNTAFSLESSLEEVLFIAGPALATVLATQVGSWVPSVIAVVSLAVGGYAFLALKDNPNALLTIDIEGKREMALAKHIQRDPVRRTIEHVDFVSVRAGEKVTVDVPVHVVGESAPGTEAQVLDGITDDLPTRSFLSAVARLGRYADAEDVVAADVLAEASRGGAVRYLDGGWQRLVDQLHAAATSAGAQVRREADAARLERHPLEARHG